MGSKSSSQVIGYAYFLDFAYTFCEHIDELYTIYRNGTSTWDNPSTGVPTSITCRTGTTASVGGSGWVGEASTIKMYDGDQANIPEMISWTGLDIGYLNTCTAVFPQAFIGDNVQTVSKFELLCGNQSFEGISAHKILPSGNANPIDIIYNILITDLKMDISMINTTSFINAALTVYNEGIGVGLIMGNTRKVMDWINEQLEIVDGVLFIDSVTNKLTLKLLRDDYDVNTIVELNDDNTSAVTLESVSWAQTYNKFVFKFTNLYTGKEISTELINTAARTALGYDRVKTLSFASINDGAVMNIIATRTVNKLGIPLAALKAAVDYIDYPNINVGDAIKFSSNNLNVVDKVFRVVKITGDNEESPTLNIECVEDFFAKSYVISVPDPDTGSGYTPPDYSLLAPAHYTAKDAQREMSALDSIVWFATKGDASEFVLSSNCEQVGGYVSASPPAVYCTLNTQVVEDIGGLGTALVSSKEYNNSYTFRVNDVDGTLFEYFGTDNTLQNLRHVAYINNEEISFKSITDLGGDVFEVEGVIRGLNDTPIVVHNVGSPIYISAEDGRFTSVLAINNATPNLKFFNHNHLEVSPVADLQINYTYTTGKPYNPVPYQTAWGATKTFSWRPRVALSGANYRNEDRIVAGEDEGKVTGYYEIVYPNATTSIITPIEGDTLINQDTTQTGVHYVRHRNTDTQRYESSVAITIT